MNTKIIQLSLLLMFIVLLIVGQLTPDTLTEAEIEHTIYCEQVERFHETNGEYGWEPYKGECDGS